VSEPHGPIKIAANRQIVLPKTLTDRLHLQPGDMVYVLQSDSEPHSLPSRASLRRPVPKPRVVRPHKTVFGT
jgi:AbrB family looped-hinge helix DNA binding protein